jgi:hypothetical protein
VIGKDLKMARNLVEQFRALIDFSLFSPEIFEEFSALASTATDERFPGGLLMFPRLGKPIVFYAVASDASEWRRLRPLLTAYVGPTLTTFRGWPEKLKPNALPSEALLQSARLHLVARFVSGEGSKVQAFVSRSLQRMVSVVTTAPSTTSLLPQSTDRLLAHFSDCLNGNSYDGAQQILEQCEREMRVDTLNLLFLKVRLLAWFGNWQAIVDMTEFRALCQTRRPPAVNAALLEAVYKVRAGDQSDIATLETKWKKTLRSDFLSLLILPIPPGCSRGALMLYALEALTVTTRNTSLEAAILAHHEVIPELANALRSAGRTGIQNDVALPVTIGGVPEAQRALVRADRANTLESIGNALRMIDALDQNERENLLGSSTFRALWHGLRSSSAKPPPESWQEWFDRLQEPDFTDALQVLQHAVVEWPAVLLIDPVEVTVFVRALQRVPDSTPSWERLADALPSLVTWTLEDPAFPRPGMLEIYDTLLFHLMVGVRRSNAVFESAAAMIRALFHLGLSRSRYQALLDDCLMLTGDAMSKRSVYWLLDVIEETLLNPCPDEEARRGFWYAACARLIQMKAFFSPGQDIVFNKLAIELGWPEVRRIDELVPENVQRQKIRADLDGRFVAIYTLTESAGRQAANVLNELVPSVRVEVSHDKVASGALRHMAQQADIFVLVTASAKHAATGVIQQERRDKLILYANGRGFSSIMRAIESHILGGEQ